jgi:hypothetical protein
MKRLELARGRFLGEILGWLVERGDDSPFVFLNNGLDEDFEVGFNAGTRF